MELQPSRPASSHRITLLGASNFVRGLPALIEALESAFGTPLQILAAVGHGRSYGHSSTVLGRTLPGITQCGLWKALDKTACLPTYAIIGDIGNDILFGYPAPEILSWVMLCLDRLAAQNARMVLILPPLQALMTLKPALYYPVRTMLYPKCSISWTDAIRQAQELDQELRQLAIAREVPTVEPASEWIGFDRIHVRQRAFREFWQAAVARLTDIPPHTTHRLHPMEVLALKLAVPEERIFWGMKQRGRQPAVTLRGGTMVGLY